MSIIRSLLASAAALTLALAIPASALAETRNGADRAAEHQKQSFPIKADKFEEIVSKRISHAREMLDGMLTKHSVPEAMRTQIRKDFDDSAAQVRAAAKRVAADGTVTREEAKEVRDVAKDLKQKLMEKYAPHAGKKQKRAA